jgi:hypothetical protein
MFRRRRGTRVHSEVDPALTQQVHQRFDGILQARGLLPNPHAFPLVEGELAEYLYEGDRATMTPEALRWTDDTDPDSGVELWIRVRTQAGTVEIDMEYLEIPSESGSHDEGAHSSTSRVEAALSSAAGRLENLLQPTS